jgi:cytochrome c oxidase subunit 3
MTTTATLNLPGDGGSHRSSVHAGSIGLWAFIGVATALFALFITAYAMRMRSPDWSPIAMPWQLWLSTAVLLGGSVMLQWASHAARSGAWPRAQGLLLTGGLCAIGFVLVQLWAWQALQSARVGLSSNPAASFFYLLTAMHGLHVVGGLVAWLAAMRWARQEGDSPRAALAIALCARYWHFLLVVWGVLFAALGWLTPEMVEYICGPEVVR